MKKCLLLVSLLCLSIVATLAFVNNIFAVVSWWRSFIAAGGDSASMEAAHGCIGWLEWSAVDHSAVTTLIPMVGFWCMTFGLVKIMRGRSVKADNFPFFKGSDQLNVALGLFGTLWGIIVIGYFNLATVSMSDLMQCLHTALFSTLMAVVWVFMIDRPIVRPLFARMLESANLAETDNDDLAAAVERLVVRLDSASESFDRRQKAYEESFDRRQRTYEDVFQKTLKSYESDLEKRHRTYADSFDRFLKDCEDACVRRQSAYETAFDSRLKASEEAFESRRKAYEERFEKRLAEYEKEFDLRQKEYVEFFSRRIGELEKRVLEEKERADAFNAKLVAVTAALK